MASAPGRIARVIAIVLLSFAAIAGTGIVLIVATEFGRERVRRAVVHLASGTLRGSVHLGALTFGPGCRVHADSVVVRDPNDSLFISVGPLEARCAALQLLKGRIVLTAISLRDPNVVLRRDTSGAWNYAGILPPRTGSGSGSAVRFSVHGILDLSGGHFRLDQPWRPGTARSIAVAQEQKRVYRSGTGFISRLEWSGIGVQATDVRLGDGAPPSMTISRLDVDLAFPPFRIQRGQGRAWLEQGAVHADLPALTLADSAGNSRSYAKVAGWIRPGGGGKGLQVDVTIHSDTLALADVDWIVPGRIPSVGGGRGAVRITNIGLPRGVVRFLVSDTDIQTLHSHVSGSLVAETTPRGLRLDDVAMTAGPLDQKLLAITTGGSFPFTVDRRLSASIHAHGKEPEQLTIDSAALLYRGQGSNPENPLLLAGILEWSAGGALKYRQVRVSTPGFDATSLATVWSRPRQIPGAISGTILFDYANGVFDLHDADLSYRRAAGSGALTVQLLRGSGWAVLAGSTTPTPRYHVTGDGQLRVTTPSDTLEARVQMSLEGDSLAQMDGGVAAAALRGRVRGIPILQSEFRLGLSEGRVRVDTFNVATAAGVVRATGALGVHRSDTLTMHARIDSLRLLQPVWPRAPEGAGVADLTLTGSLDSLVADASADLRNMRGASLTIAKVQAEGDVRWRRGEGIAPIGMSLRADSVAGGSRVFRSIEASAKSPDGVRWQGNVQTGPADSTGGIVSVAVVIDSVRTRVDIDSLRLVVPGAELRSLRPASLRIERGGVVALDSVLLRGSRGSRVNAAGSIARDGSITAFARIDSFPLRILPDTGLTGITDAILSLDARISGRRENPVVSLSALLHRSDTTFTTFDTVRLVTEYQNGRGHLDLRGMRSARELLQATAELPIDLSISPLRLRPSSGEVHGRLIVDSLALADLAPLLPALRPDSGVLRAQLDLAGEFSQPRVRGTVAVTGGRFDPRAWRTGPARIDAELRFADDSVIISRLAVGNAGGEAWDGSLTGSVRLDSAGPVFGVALTTHRLPVKTPDGVADLAVSSELMLRGPWRGPRVAGVVTVDRGELGFPRVGASSRAGRNDPEFMKLLDSLTRRDRAPRRTGSSTFLRGMVLDSVRVALGPDVWIRSTDASIKLGGDIMIMKGPAAGREARGLALRGDIKTERGTYTLDLGVIHRTFNLEEGSVRFEGEPELNPHLDIKALYTVKAEDSFKEGRDLRIRAKIGGRLKSPSLELSSVDGPAQTQEQLLTYLLTGQKDVTVAQGNIAQQEVSSELISQVMTGAARRLTGGLFDVMSVTPGSTNQVTNQAGSLATSRLSFGKQLTERTFLTVDTGLCGLGGESSGSVGFSDALGLSLDYRLRSTLSLKLRSDPGSSATTCTQAATSRGFAPTPRQWGVNLEKRWRF